MQIRKGDLVKYRKQPYFTYRIYRIRQATDSWITLVPALNYVNSGMIEVPISIMKIPELFSFLDEKEKKEFEMSEFKHACYLACTEIDILNDKLEKLKDKTDNHRIDGEISIALNKINKKFERLLEEE